MDTSPDQVAIEKAVQEGTLTAEVGGFILTCAMIGYQTLASEGAFAVTAAFEIENDDRHGVALLPQNDTPFENKDMFMHATRHFADHVDAKHVAIISECWTVVQRVSEVGNLDKPSITESLANHPDRREALIVLSEHKDQHVQLSYNIERASDEKITGISFQSLNISPQHETTGRLTRLRFTDEERKGPMYAASQKAMELIFTSLSEDEIPADGDQLGSKHGLN